MGTVYTEVPHNWNAMQPYVRTDRGEFAKEILAGRKCFFYDTCSFRRHARIGEAYAGSLLNYMRKKDGIVVLSRCILMELAAQSGILNQEYIEYCRRMEGFGVPVFVIYEEDIFSVMEICYGTNARINSMLSWAVRMLKSPVSTITRVLEEDRSLRDEVVKGKNRDRGGLYGDFFAKVRGNKESQDNLGEELLAICLHILSQFPGEADGKFCIITDDRGAAHKIDQLFRRTNRKFRGSRIILFSTPKLVQTLYEEGLIRDESAVQAWLRAGTVGNITVLGTQVYDLKSNEISLGCEELARLIREKGIHVLF
ncbi:MAG: hypothetical protein HFH93_09795 [Lachnospiraceae bacterium]|nr:hypothetical protein [Lachnospiraceae bacterium]